VGLFFTRGDVRAEPAEVLGLDGLERPQGTVAAAVAAAEELAPFGAQDDDAAMPHSLIADPVGEVAIQSGAVVSKVVHRGDGMNVTVFGFDSGEELTEHQAARAAVVQVLSGRLRFTVDGEQLDLLPGSWLHMAPGTPHSLIASEPTVMLLTLAGS
jgi:quercetin dioxygenase-like cupin family protein